MLSKDYTAILPGMEKLKSKNADKMETEIRISIE